MRYVDAIHQRLEAEARSFGAAAAAYERGRPAYPARAIDWLLPSTARRVLDLGAGTGKLTRQLRERGLDVVAVEPSSEMREQLTRALPDVRVLAGTAEAIPLDDQAVDAVLVAQAWHWVDAATAVPEVARVLSPGGRLGLLWNVRDEREDWVAQLGRIVQRDDRQDAASATPTVGPPFEPVERLDIEWRYRLTRDALIDLVASRSAVIALPDPQREAVLTRVRHLTGTHPDLADVDEVVLPYVTRCHRADLAARVSGGCA